MKRIKHLLLLALACISVSSYAQFDGPYRIAFNTSTNTFLVSNKEGGTISELNSSFQPKDVITGLSNPTDIEVASFGANTGVLILDDKKVKLFSSTTYASALDFAVPGASELIDLAIDPNNVGDFYITDRGNNAIIKGVVGPPPFYIPTFTTLVDTGLHRPSALMFDREGQLLVAFDSLESPIIEVNTSNGSLKTLYKTGLDSINAMAQDSQGNIFITNWGDSKQYRIDSGYTKMTEIVALNKPAGMFIDAGRNLLITACFKCNKLEFKSLHLLIPQSDVYMCTNDSATIFWDIRFNGASTWGTDNAFIVEVSDSSGDFTKGKIAARIQSKTKPRTIAFKPPSMDFGSVHKYRVRSTRPDYIGSEKSIYFFETPEAFIADQDTLYTCEDAELQLGKPGQNNTTYLWSPSTSLSSGTIANPVFKNANTGTYAYSFKAENNLAGCSDSASVVVIVQSDARLAGLSRNKQKCFGDSVQIGVNRYGYVFEWSPGTDLSDSTSAQPVFSGNDQKWLFVDITDTVSGCTGLDSVFVRVNPLPIFDVPDTVRYCEGETLNIQHSTDTSYTYIWSPVLHFIDSSAVYPSFRSFPSRMDDVAVRAITKEGCEDSTSLVVDGIPRDLEASAKWVSKDSAEVNITLKGLGLTVADVQSIELQRYDTAIQTWEVLKQMEFLGKDTFLLRQHDSLRMEYETVGGCTYAYLLELPKYVSIAPKNMPTWDILKNPVYRVLEIDGVHPKLHYDIISPSGQSILKGQLSEKDDHIDVSALTSGVYILKIASKAGEQVSIRLVKLSK
jgi:sugar lactone lactonase YvrE